MEQTIRTFIAIPLPKIFISWILEVQEQLKSYRFPVRWVKPENIHLTLKFLGNIPIKSIDSIAMTMDDTFCGCPPMTLFAKGLGVFPGIKKPRVIWLGLSGDIKALSGLQANLESNLEKIGFLKENRQFKSHLTLGRIKGHIEPKNLFDALRSFSEFTSEPFDTKELILYKSELKPSGASYIKLKTVFATGPEQ
ncbi:MAG: RNA 2',3'-cyclic phosphodiesterase [Desulfobacterales bacterium]